MCYITLHDDISFVIMEKPSALAWINFGDEDDDWKNYDNLVNFFVLWYVEN